MRTLTLLLGVCIITILVSSCVGQGRISVVDFDYPKSYNLINYGRTVEFTIILHNYGNGPCTITHATSPHFWNTDNPGLTGMFKDIINVELDPDMDYVLKLFAYLRDGDLIYKHKKDFEIFLYSDENCDIDQYKLQGFLELDIENEQIPSDLQLPIIYYDTPTDELMGS